VIFKKYFREIPQARMILYRTIEIRHGHQRLTGNATCQKRSKKSEESEDSIQNNVDSSMGYSVGTAFIASGEAATLVALHQRQMRRRRLT
jgi:hypothetical protein